MAVARPFGLVLADLPVHSLLLLLERHRAFDSLGQILVEVVRNLRLHFFIHALVHYV